MMMNFDLLPPIPPQRFNYDYEVELEDSDTESIEVELDHEEDEDELEVFKLGQYVFMKNEVGEIVRGRIVRIKGHVYHVKMANENKEVPVFANRLIVDDNPIKPDFSFIKDNNSKTMISSAYDCTTERDEWNLIRHFKGESFMFCNDHEINSLESHIDNMYEQGHSGSSMGWTMRQLQRISHVGYHKFKEEWIEHENKRTNE